MALAEDSANLPEGWFHTLPRLQQLQDSVSTTWHSTAFPGPLRSWPINSVKTRVQLRQLGLYMWSKVGNTVTRNTRTSIVLFRPSGKDLLNVSWVPRYLVRSREVAKEMEFTMPITISCWTSINSYSLLNRFLNDKVDNVAVMWAAVQNTQRLYIKYSTLYLAHSTHSINHSYYYY